MPAKKTTLESLARLISKASASADNKFAALAEDIADMKSKMATKDDLAATVRAGVGRFRDAFVPPYRLPVHGRDPRRA